MGKISYLQRSLLAQFRPDRFICPNCGCAKSDVIEQKFLVTRLCRCLNCHLMFRTPTDIPSANSEFYDAEYNQGFTTQMPTDKALAELLETKFSGKGFFALYKCSFSTWVEA
jgi:hypothetical protein